MASRSWQACSPRLFLGKIIYNLTIDAALYGMKIGFAAWLGFVMTVQLTDTLFGNRPMKLS